MGGRNDSHKGLVVVLWDRLIGGFVSRKVELTIFLLSCVISSMVLFTSPLDPFSEGSDAWYFVILGQRMADILKNFPDFIWNFVSGGYTQAQYQQMGFVDPTGIYTVFRALFYVFYLSIVISLFGVSKNVMLCSQMCILASIFVLIYQILSKFVSRKMALILTVVSMFHYSFYISAARPESELFLCFFLLLTWKQCMITFEAPKPKKMFLLGFLLMWTSLIKSSMTFLFVLAGGIICTWIYLRFRESHRRLLAGFFAGMLIPALFCSILYSRTNNTIGFIEMGLGGRNFYAGQQYYSDCFYTNAQYQNRWFVEEAKKISSQVNPQRWFAQFSEVSSAAVAKTFLNDFPNAFAFTVKKVAFLTAFPPSNVYPEIKRFVFLQGNYLMIVHSFVLVLAFISIFILRGQYPLKIFFTATYVYHLAVYGLTNIVTRYFISLLPFFIIMAALTVAMLKPKMICRDSLIVAALLVLLVTLFLGRPPLIAGDYLYSQILKILLVNAIFGVLVFFVFFRLMRGIAHDEIILPGLLSTFVIICLNVFMLTDRDLLRTTIRADTTVAKEIQMPPAFKASDYEAFYLLVDFVKGSADYNVLFNGTRIDAEIIEDKSPIIWAIDKAWGANERKWTYIKLPSNLVGATNRVEISSPNDIQLYADYVSGKLHYLPSFVHYVTGYEIVYGPVYTPAIDKRVYMSCALNSVGSTWVDGKSSCSKDVRVYIVGKRLGGYVMPQKYAHLMDIHPFLLSLLRLPDQGLVVYKKESLADDVPIRGEMIKVLLGEVETFDTGYDLF